MQVACFEEQQEKPFPRLCLGAGELGLEAVRYMRVLCWQRLLATNWFTDGVVQCAQVSQRRIAEIPELSFNTSHVQRLARLPGLSSRRITCLWDRWLFLARIEPFEESMSGQQASVRLLGVS